MYVQRPAEIYNLFNLRVHILWNSFLFSNYIEIFVLENLRINRKAIFTHCKYFR